MESWIYYAVIAAVFIVVRDVFGKKYHLNIHLLNI